MTVTLGFDVEEFDFPLERGREIDLQTQLAVSSAGLGALLSTTTNAIRNCGSLVADA